MRHAGREDGYRWWQGDLAKSSVVRELVEIIKPDIIFHLASHNVGARDLDIVIPTFHSNLMSTVNLLTAAAEIGCRRIVLSGSMDEPEPGDWEAVPCSPYAAAKWASNAYARMFHVLYHLPIVILRIFWVYGPAQQNKLIPYVILSLLKGEAPKLTSGHRQIDWIYVDDVIEALLAAVSAVDVEGLTIDVGSGELTTIRSVVEHLVRLINPEIDPLFGALPDRPLEQQRVAQPERAQAMMGWKVITPLEEGLKRTVDWYQRRLLEGLL
jgi:nucleoside-diphosphate-sugar epimerase